MGCGSRYPTYHRQIKLSVTDICLHFLVHLGMLSSLGQEFFVIPLELGGLQSVFQIWQSKDSKIHTLPANCFQGVKSSPNRYPTSPACRPVWESRLLRAKVGEGVLPLRQVPGPVDARCQAAPGRQSGPAPPQCQRSALQGHGPYWWEVQVR